MNMILLNLKIKWIELIRNPIVLIINSILILLASACIYLGINDRISLNSVGVGFVNEDHGTISNHIIDEMKLLSQYSIYEYSNDEVLEALLKHESMVIYAFPKNYTEDWNAGKMPKMDVSYLKGDTLAPFVNEQIISLGMMDFLKSMTKDFYVKQRQPHSDILKLYEAKWLEYMNKPYTDELIKIKIVSTTQPVDNGFGFDIEYIYRRILVGIGFFLFLIMSYLSNVTFWQENENHIRSRKKILGYSQRSGIMLQWIWTFAHLFLSIGLSLFGFALAYHIPIKLIYILYLGLNCSIIGCMILMVAYFSKNVLQSIQHSLIFLLIFGFFGSCFFDVDVVIKHLTFLNTCIPLGSMVDWVYTLLIMQSNTVQLNRIFHLVILQVAVAALLIIEIVFFQLLEKWRVK